jgi:hypothetical protein
MYATIRSYSGRSDFAHALVEHEDDIRPAEAEVS